MGRTLELLAEVEVDASTLTRNGGVLRIEPAFQGGLAAKVESANLVREFGGFVGIGGF